MSDAIRLDASSLYSKWGFADGDILDDVLWEFGFGDVNGLHHGLHFDHEVLARCVERFLLPAIPYQIVVERYGTLHNPIRARDDVPADLSGCGVEISVDDVLAVANEVRAEFQRDATP